MSTAVKQYQQCLLHQGTKQTTRWIPSHGARLGASVEMLPERDFWDVVAVYDHCLPEDVLKSHQLMNRNSLPSIEPMGAPPKQAGKVK